MQLSKTKMVKNWSCPKVDFSQASICSGKTFIFSCGEVGFETSNSLLITRDKAEIGV